MNWMRSSTWLVLAALILAGCQGGTSTAEKPKAEGEPVASSGDGSTEGKEETPAKVEVPADLKGPAYEYYGIGSGKPVTYTVTSPQMNGKTTIEFEVKEVKDGEAIVQSKRTGVGAEQASDTQLILKKDGLYSTQFNGVPLNPPVMELPNDLTQGKKYTAKASVSTNGQEMVLDLTNTVGGIEKVKTARGTFDALRIKTTGSMKVGTVTAKLDVEQWLVKGIGVVKYVANTTSPQGKQLATMDIDPE